MDQFYFHQVRDAHFFTNNLEAHVVENRRAKKRGVGGKHRRTPRFVQGSPTFREL